MAINLKKGESINLSKREPNLRKIRVGLGWDKRSGGADFDLDVSVFVCNLNATTSQTYYLQPGNYRIEWRAKSLKGSIYTIEKKFTVKSDIETKVELYK